MRRLGALAGLVILVVAAQAHVGRSAGPGASAGRSRTAKLAPLPSPYVVAGGGRVHRVQAGETLTALAKKYRTGVGELARANGLRDADLLLVGQRLQVPGGRWLCPVAGRRSFSRGWGAPRPQGRRHLGVDVFAPRGTPVVASVGGTIHHRPGAVAGLAYYLHGDDGNDYYGAHLDQLVARPGRVERGALIGRVGTTGNARETPPHLHFEFKPGRGGPVDPYPTLARRC